MKSKMIWVYVIYLLRPAFCCQEASTLIIDFLCFWFYVFYLDIHHIIPSALLLCRGILYNHIIPSGLSSYILCVVLHAENHQLTTIN